MIAEAESELEKRHPGISEVIDHRSAATPLTLERYTGHWEGASFGTKFEGYALSDDLPKIIRGLYHTGSCGIVMSGWLGAVNYGAIVANRVDAEMDM
jgi:phytoene dehydrogenase-like protein